VREAGPVVINQAGRQFTSVRSSILRLFGNPDLPTSLDGRPARPHNLKASSLS